MAGLNGYGKTWPLLIVIAVATAAATWHWVLRAEAVSYGDPAKTYFKPAQAAEGDKIEMCFDDVTWHRLCRGRLVTYLAPAKGPRMELDDYAIKTPLATGKVAPKCRQWAVPTLGSDREEGPAVVGGHAELECWPLDHWSPINTALPPIKLNVARKK